MSSQTRDIFGEYRKDLARWTIAAGFWLVFWWFFTIGAIVASTLSAASPSFLMEKGKRSNLGEVVAWFAVASVSITAVVRPWRFHRGYQVAAYRLQIALRRAEMDPLAATVHREFVSGIDKILDAGSELDDSDGLHETKVSADRVAPAATPGGSSPAS